MVVLVCVCMLMCVHISFCSVCCSHWCSAWLGQVRQRLLSKPLSSHYGKSGLGDVALFTDCNEIKYQYNGTFTWVISFQGDSTWAENSAGHTWHDFALGWLEPVGGTHMVWLDPTYLSLITLDFGRVVNFEQNSTAKPVLSTSRSLFHIGACLPKSRNRAYRPWLFHKTFRYALLLCIGMRSPIPSPRSFILHGWWNHVHMACFLDAFRH